MSGKTNPDISATPPTPSHGADPDARRTRDGGGTGTVRKHAKGLSLFHASQIIQQEDLADFRVVGGGNFGRIWVADYLGTDVAVKELLRVDGQSPAEFDKYTIRELGTLRDCRHPNVVQFLGIVRSTPSQLLARLPELPASPTTPSTLARDGYSLITEFVPGGNIRHWIDPAPDDTLRRSFPWPLRISFAIDTARACAYLESRGIVHRDLKPENLLVTDNNRIKVCDFGFSRSTPRPDDDVERRRLSFCGTDGYMSPEMMLCMPFDARTDVFSFGVVLAELIARASCSPDRFRRVMPGLGLDPDEIRSYGTSMDDCGCPPPAGLVDLAVQCCADEPKLRPEWKDILRRLKEAEAEALKRMKQGEGDVPEPKLDGHAPPSNVNESGSRHGSTRVPVHIGLMSGLEASDPALGSLSSLPSEPSLSPPSTTIRPTNDTLRDTLSPSSASTSTSTASPNSAVVVSDPLPSPDVAAVLSLGSPDSITPTAATAAAVATPSSSTLSRPGLSHEIPHRFSLSVCLGGIKCQVCYGKVGFAKRFLECDDCGFISHKRCGFRAEPVCGMSYGMIMALAAGAGGSGTGTGGSLGRAQGAAGSGTGTGGTLGRGQESGK